MSLSALQASAYLHHLAIASSDPQRLAGFYAEVMDMTATRLAEGLWMASGPARRVVISSGTANSLVSAGFAVRDAEALAGLRARVQDRQLSVAGAETRLFRPGAFSVRDPDGNSICFGLAAAGEVTPANAIRGPMQHLTLASRDIEAMEEFYADKLGFGVSDRVVNENGKLMTVFMRGTMSTIISPASSRTGKAWTTTPTRQLMTGNARQWELWKAEAEAHAIAVRK